MKTVNTQRLKSIASGGLLLLFSAAAAAGAATEAQYLYRSGELSVSDRRFQQIFAVLKKQHTDPEALRQRAEGYLERLRRDLLLAAAARSEGYSSDPVVTGPYERYREVHLVDMYLQAEVIQPARDYARREAEAKGGSEKLLFRQERDRLSRELTAAAAGLVEAETYDAALAAAVGGKEENPVVARLGGAEVRFEVLRPGLAQLSHPSMREGTDLSLAQTVLRSFIARQRLVTAAQKKKYPLDPKYILDVQDKLVETLAAAYEGKIYSKVSVRDEDVEAYFEEHREEFRRGEEKQVYEILVKDLETAKDVRRRLQMGDSFDYLVRKLSVGVTKEKGGLLGWIQRGDLIRVLDGAVMGLEVGGISQVIKTEYGFHVLACTGEQEGRMPSLEEIRGRVAPLAELELRSRALEKRVGELEKEIPIDVNEDRLEEIRGSL